MKIMNENFKILCCYYVEMILSPQNRIYFPI